MGSSTGVIWLVENQLMETQLVINFFIKISVSYIANINLLLWFIFRFCTSGQIPLPIGANWKKWWKMWVSYVFEMWKIIHAQNWWFFQIVYDALSTLLIFFFEIFTQKVNVLFETYTEICTQKTSHAIWKELSFEQLHMAILLNTCHI